MGIKIKHLLAMSLAVFLSACNQPPVQTNAYEEPVSIQQEYDDNDGIDTGDVALGVATGAVVGAVAKSAYDKRKTKRKQVVVVNKYYNGNSVSSYKKQSFRKPYSRSKRK